MVEMAGMQIITQTATEATRVVVKAITEVKDPAECSARRYATITKGPKEGLTTTEVVNI